MRRWYWTLLVAAVLVGAAGLLAGVSDAIGQNLPKLPDETAIRQSAASPGKVTFRHISHMGDRPDCTRCHPKLFSIVKGTPATADRVITHAKMEKGRQCGACHNGKTAFGFDNCAACHLM